jgi:hypothetical protein
MMHWRTFWEKSGEVCGIEENENRKNCLLLLYVHVNDKNMNRANDDDDDDDYCCVRFFLRPTNISRDARGARILERRGV